MSCLLFMDTDRAERAKKAKELQSIFETIMEEGHTMIGAERATLFMLDEDSGELWSRVATGTKGIIKVPKSAGIVGACVTSGEIINIPDAYLDSRFNKEVDKSTGYHTKSVLAVPVRSNDKILGAIQMINKQEPDGSDASFSANDEKMVVMLASHAASFIQIVTGD
jgi:GAF domain-containing protein